MRSTVCRWGRKSSATFVAIACLALTAQVLADTGNERARVAFEVGPFVAAFDESSQVLVSLGATADRDFDFLPVDRLEQRRGDGYYHLGDIDLRLRVDGEWRDVSSALPRRAVEPMPATGDTLLAAGLPLAGVPGFAVERRWLRGDDALRLEFTLRNDGDRAVEIGGLGLPMAFNSILTDRTLEEAHARASFVDPYVGRDAGYVQVTRLNGAGPALLVLPDGATPLEAWKPVLDASGPEGEPLLYNDPTPRGITFEGFHAWMVATRGFATEEWQGVRQWNPPTSLTIAPGESRTIGLRFVTAPAIREIEETLVARDRPVAIGIPGYVVATDLDAQLFVNAPAAIESIDVFPGNALTVARDGRAGDWARLRIGGRQFGRARLELRYADGSRQAVHYFVIRPAAETVRKLGRFLFDEQWFDDPDDPFGRAPSILGYDRERDSVIRQEHRAWIAGLSDEGGAGSWLAGIMKQLGQPDPGEVAKFERFVTETLDGGLQYDDGPRRFGVRRSLFYYDPGGRPDVAYDPDRDWSLWSAWSREHAATPDRSFNYVHVAAAHWVLYKLARYREGFVTAHDWRWYLEHAYETAMAMVRLAPHYAQFGQMEGSVFVEILKDLQREGMNREARALEAVMQGRAVHWRNLAFPFGSEMPWDSTGQEEVYAWMRWFGDDDKADITREVILGYDPTVPHWGYNGSARRYWDFLYAGKRQRIERQLHHYGSANNAIPLFDSYRRDPADIHLLRVAYGGLQGVLTNIDEDGFGSAAFHSFPDALHFDAYSGDYGTGFFGHAFATASYLLEHPEFGWLGFGGSVDEDGSMIRLSPKDSFRTRVFVAPAGLWLTLDAGAIERVDFDSGSGRVTLQLAPADRHTPRAWLRIDSTVAGRPGYRPAMEVDAFRGAWPIELEEVATRVELLPE